MNEFGKNNKRTILLIHGAGTSYKMWSEQIDVLKGKFHVYAPTLNGHEGDFKSEFISPEVEARCLSEWFDKAGVKKIDIVCGVSLGAMVASELLLLKPDFATYAFIESLKHVSLGKYGNKIFCIFGKWFLKQSIKVKGTVPGSYGKVIPSDDMKEVMGSMSDATFEHILITTCSYDMDISKRKGDISAKTYIVYGQKEEKECKEMTERFAKCVSNNRIFVLPKYRHGELAIANPKKYLALLNRLIKEAW